MVARIRLLDRRAGTERTGLRPRRPGIRAFDVVISGALQPGMLVVLESTTYPGTTEEVFCPILERGSGLRAGHDFHVAFSPERIDPGNARFGLADIPKVVGGITPASTEHAIAFYRRFIGTVVAAKRPREAEIAKLLENTYRYVNIAPFKEM